MARTSNEVIGVTGNGSLTDSDGRQIFVGPDGVSPLGHNVTGIGHGRKTSTSVGTAVALTTTQAAKYVVVTALLTNTQQVNIGASGVVATAGSSTGTPLMAGDSLILPVDDVADVFVDVRVSGEGVSFTYLT